MDKDTVIKVENLSKKFTRSLKRSMVYGSIDLARDFIGFPTDRGKLRKSEFWSLKDLNFELKRGEKVGFIGSNGSGKTTLLRLITGIFPPDKGRIEVRGSIGALIAVGAGFHPHMTGRENIYLNGVILGMTRKEIDEKYQDIVDFSEVGEFIEAPVSTYSSGMRVKLGFSVAVHTVPDIMLVDEVLSVGDMAFGIKSRRKLDDLIRNGGTFLLVSHNMQAVRNSCDRVIWLEKGMIKMDGETDYVVDEYENIMLQKGQSFQGRLIRLDDTVLIENVEFIKEGISINQIGSGEDIKCIIKINTSRVVRSPIVTFTLSSEEGVIVFESYSNFDKNVVIEAGNNKEILLNIDKLRIRPGNYKVTVTLSEDSIMNKLEWHDKVYNLRVLKSDKEHSKGLIKLEHKWEIRN